MNNSASVSVGHGPGTPRNEGTAKDRGTPAPDSNLTEIDATQERGAVSQDRADSFGKKPADPPKQGERATSK